MTHLSPEQKARQHIDQLLTAAGWTVQSKDELNLYAAHGVAVREPLLRTGEADYLLFVDQKALGVIEAKAEGTTLRGVTHQSAAYSIGLMPYMKAWLPGRALPFRYESTGIETLFLNDLDPKPRSREIFAFHQPTTLAAWVQETATLRSRLQGLPALDTAALWKPQIEAIQNLELSLANNKPRALIQMATGSGKTITAINFVYRLIRYGGAQRVLFLVDRNNLGEQALTEFQAFTTPDDGRKFVELYNIQHLKSNVVDRDSKVVITTIQRLYSMLRNDDAFPEENEVKSFFQAEEEGVTQQPVTVGYNSHLPLEFFDFVITDECHRSIYNLWRQVLEYFDAFLIGLTATPTAQTIGFFAENLVMRYTHLDAVADGINVLGEVYPIRTQITEQGSTVARGEFVMEKERNTRRRRDVLLGEDFVYSAGAVGADVIAPSQIRLVINTFRQALFTKLFPERRPDVVPKTLIFARDDNHAEEIVKLVQEIFNEGNDFCQKITYRVTKKKPDELISEFRNKHHPRIAVTVDMIATGTDVKAIEVLIFMRMVKSRSYFEQMLGRGTRVITKDDLQLRTNNATVKDRFIIVDAVGVTQQEQVEIARTLNRKPSTNLKQLLTQVSYGAQDADTLTTLATRLVRLEHKLTPGEQYEITALSGGLTLPQLARELLTATDPERHLAAACAATGKPADAVSEADLEAATTLLLQAAALRFAGNPRLCQKLIDIHERTIITYDDVSRDRLIREGFDEGATERARTLLGDFRTYLDQHKDEITALRLLYSQPYRRQGLTLQAIKELADVLQQPPRIWTTEKLWRAYAQLEQDRVKGLTAQRVTTDIVALVRHALDLDGDAELQPYPDQVRHRYERWLADQQAGGRSFTPQQRWWLDRIADYIGLNLSIDATDLNAGDFLDNGGLFGAMRELGQEWRTLVAELNEVLVV